MNLDEVTVLSSVYFLTLELPGHRFRNEINWFLSGGYRVKKKT